MSLARMKSRTGSDICADCSAPSKFEYMLQF